MTAFQARIAQCPEPTCVLRTAHTFHRDGKGRSWGFRGLPVAPWLGRLTARETAR